MHRYAKFKSSIHISEHPYVQDSIYLIGKYSNNTIMWYDWIPRHMVGQSKYCMRYYKWNKHYCDIFNIIDLCANYESFLKTTCAITDWHVVEDLLNYTSYYAPWELECSLITLCEASSATLNFRNHIETN